MEKQLPTIVIEGTEFTVDVSRQELREVQDPSNTISFLEMEDRGTHYILRYDPDLKNLREDFGKQVIDVHIPQMAQLDAEGMAAHHGISADEVRAKTDFEIIVNQELVALRQNGQLPVIEIAGQPFYVDIRMDSLRPKDDFCTPGIRFSDIDFCYMDEEMAYRIPYDPKTRSFVDVDFNSITSVPKELIIIDIPHPCKLDAIGYARKYNMDSKEILRRHPPQADMKAIVVPWKETPIEEIIARNLKKINKLSMGTQQKKAKRKGRGL